MFQTSPTFNCQNDHVSLITQTAVTLKPNPLETPELSSPLFSPGAILEGGWLVHGSLPGGHWSSLQAALTPSSAGHLAWAGNWPPFLGHYALPTARHPMYRPQRCL